MRAARLKYGDTIGIIAPAGCSDPEAVYSVLQLVREMGFKYKEGASLYQYKGYLAGEDEVRAADINNMFRDPEVDAVFCIRGGYGCGRLLDKIDYKAIRKNPKIFIGYSDITALHIALFQKTGLITFHGPMLASDFIKGIDEFTAASFEAALMSDLDRMDIVNPAQYTLKSIRGGSARGKLIGGNLSVIASTLGTSYEINTKDRILFLEDIGEEPYRIDRMLNQLRLAGKLRDAAGILLCDWNCCEAEEPSKSLTLEEIFEDMAEYCRKPMLSGYKIGHCNPMLTIPYGAKAYMNADDLSFSIVEKMVK